MRYTVCWRPSAERKLTEIWQSSSDKLAVTNASNEIDLLLKTRPHDVGDSRGGTARHLSLSPLAIYYEINDDDRTVDVRVVFSV